MDNLKQTALDYTLGVLPKEDSLLFEALLEHDDEAKTSLVTAQEDCANLSLIAEPASLGNEVRSRVMEYTKPRINLDPILESREIETLRENFSAFSHRYQGGGGSVDLNDLGSIALRDDIRRNYESLIELFPLVAGDSHAARGDFTLLHKFLRKQSSYSETIERNLSHELIGESPASRSVLRSALATMPSLSFFSDRLSEDDPTLSDTRRLFYLCRDQLKIMRASFRDIDPARLEDDEKLRLHGAGLLQTKWWGAEHAYFSSSGKVRCGNFFDGPVTERCVEFAEYDANVYCLANLLSPRSSDGEFHLELLKDTVPGCTLALATAKMDLTNHQNLEAILSGSSKMKKGDSLDHHLWTLIEDSMTRGHQCSNLGELRERRAYGCTRIENYTYLWFAWPAIANAQEGADASTPKPLQ